MKTYMASYAVHLSSRKPPKERLYFGELANNASFCSEMQKCFYQLRSKSFVRKDGQKRLLNETPIEITSREIFGTLKGGFAGKTSEFDDGENKLYTRESHHFENSVFHFYGDFPSTSKDGILIFEKHGNTTVKSMVDAVLIKYFREEFDVDMSTGHILPPEILDALKNGAFGEVTVKNAGKHAKFLAPGDPADYVDSTLRHLQSQASVSLTLNPLPGQKLGFLERFTGKTKQEMNGLYSIHFDNQEEENFADDVTITLKLGNRLQDRRFRLSNLNRLIPTVEMRTDLSLMQENKRLDAFVAEAREFAQELRGEMKDERHVNNNQSAQHHSQSLGQLAALPSRNIGQGS